MISTNESYTTAIEPNITIKSDFYQSLVIYIVNNVLILLC